MSGASHGDFPGRSGAVVAVTIIMAALSTIFVACRMLSRAAIVKRISVDDYFMILAWVVSCGLSASICFGAAWGLGRHETDVPQSWQAPLRRADYAFTVLYQPALMALKTSILAFYLTFSTAQRTFKWACIATLFVVNAGGLGLTILTVFQCRPLSATFRTVTPAGAHCTDIVTIYLSSAPLNLITDFAILFLPMPILTSMRLPAKQKIILVITFSFGIFVAAVDVVRIAYLQSASETRLAEIQSQQGSRSTEYQTDFSWYASLSFMWSVIEVDVGIMCACVPGLKPLVARFIPHMLRSSGDPSTKASAQNGTASTVERQPEPSVADGGPDCALRSQSVARDEGPMGMMDFLTTPDMDEIPTSLPQSQSTLTNAPLNTSPATPSFFDFVNMSGKKSMAQMTTRESIFPIAMVTVLFFIWGFEYGLLDVLNSQFQSVAHMTPGQSTSIHSAYYAGYFAGPLTCGWPLLRRWGFRACYCVGLSIFACGTLIYWPAAVLTSLPAFIITNIVVGYGLSILEVAANPFIALCGRVEYMEARLNLCQGVQAIGSVVAPLIAHRAFFQESFHAPSLVNSQWAYLGIALATILLAVLFYYIPLPETTDQELQDAMERRRKPTNAKIGTVGITWITLGFAAFSQFCYVGGQEVNATMFNAYISDIAPGYNTSNYLAIAHTAFAVGRFLAAGLSMWIKPRILLLCFYVGLIVFQILAMNYGGNTGVAMIIVVFFMEGPLFSLIFGQALHGMGRHTKTASVFITAAVSGGAVFSPISNHLSYGDGRVMYSLVVAVALFAAGSTFAVGLNGNAQARTQVDAINDETVSRGPLPRSPSSSTSSRTRSWFILGKQGTTDSADAEWREHKNREPHDPEI